jgi:hypothetical protein
LATIFQSIDYVLILTKTGLGYIMADFFTNSSGHPGGFATQISVSLVFLHVPETFTLNSAMPIVKMGGNVARVACHDEISRREKFFISSSQTEFLHKIMLGGMTCFSAIWPRSDVHINFSTHSEM